MEYIETIKIENGYVCNVEYHLQRMRRIYRHDLNLGLRIPLQFAKGRIKCRILYDADHLFEITYHPYSLPTIQSLKTIEVPDIEYDLKYADRTCLDELIKQRAQCDDILICRNGSICDTSFCNVVFENKDGLFTPSSALLYGTKRQKLIDTGLIQECEISINNLTMYNKVYLINAMIEIEDNICMPIQSILS